MNMQRARVLLSALVAVASAMTLPAGAQDFSFNKLPVLEPKPDFNGVDPGSGGYATSSPLRFSAPGAGHLDIQTWFNTRRLSFSLNMWMSDETYTPAGGDPNERHIRIHLGGVDKLFTCYGSSCTQVSEADGATLTLTPQDNYVFKDKYGTVYTFFTTRRWSIETGCTDYETGCNAAGYQADAYVSTIQYPSGEKLTYQPFSVIENNIAKDTIVSNLGYKLVFELSNFARATKAGENWFNYYSGIANRISLYQGSNLIGTLTNSAVYSNQSMDLTLTQRDGLEREYQVKLHADLRAACADRVDYTALQPVRVTSPEGVQTSIGYHPGGSADSVQVKTVTRGGHTWTYDGVAGQKTLTTPTGKNRTVTTAWYYDGYDYGAGAQQCPGAGAAGYKITSVLDELNRPSVYDYYWDDSLKLKSATLPESNGYKYEYDSRGNLTKITQVAKPASQLPERTVFEAGYDTTCTNVVKCNKPNWVKDGKGNQTDYTYDPAHGGVATVTAPADRNGVRSKTTYLYVAHDTGDGTIYRLDKTLSCITGASCANSADEHKTAYTYWNNTFLPATLTESAGDNSLPAASSYDYDAAGHRTQFTNQRGYVTYHFYDSVGRNVGEISADPDGAGPLPRLAKRISYNDDDQVRKVEAGTTTGTTIDALNSMTITNTAETVYDTAGRKTKEMVYAAGTTYSVTQFSYDDEDRLECTAVRMNPAAFNSLPSSACSLGAEGPYGPDRITRNSYTDAGELKTIQKAYGTSLQQTYARYGYSLNSKRRSVIDANGNLSRFDYDGYDRQEYWYFPSKTAGAQVNEADYEKYGYDGNDNRTSLRKRDGRVIGYEYDALNRVISKNVPDPAVDVYYGYDLRGLQKYARFGSHDGEGISITYDALGRQTSSKNNMGGVSRTLIYGHDVRGNRNQLTFPDSSNYFTYSYDALDRMTAIFEKGGTKVVGLSYDARGRRSDLTEGVGTSYAHDGLGRLASLTHDLADTAQDVTYGFTSYNPANQITTRTRSNNSYAWSPEGNVSTAYMPNGLNQYSAVGADGLSYDDNGNLTSYGSLTLSYDVENRLVSASGSKNATLSYDPLGRLYETSGGSAGKTRFLYDGDALVAEYDSAGKLARRYVHGPGVDEPLLWYETDAVSSATRNILRADHQGSIVAVTNSVGKSRGINRYDSYGVPAATIVGRFAFTGQIVIPELGMYHYKARAYSPTLGRFLQTDPVGYNDDVDLYAYVKNDPLNKTDPTGMDSASCYTEAGCGGGVAITAEGAEFAAGTLPGAGFVQGANDALAGNYMSAAFGVATEVTGSKYLKLAGELLGKIGKTFGREVVQSVKAFLKNNPIPAKAGDIDVKKLPSDGVAVQATREGNVTGSKAVYEKQIDAAGNTVQSTKTTYDPQGNIVHVKDKLTGETISPCKRNSNGLC